MGPVTNIQRSTRTLAAPLPLVSIISSSALTGCVRMRETSATRMQETVQSGAQLFRWCSRSTSAVNFQPAGHLIPALLRAPMRSRPRDVEMGP